MMSFPGAGTVLSMQIITVQTDRECFHQTVHKALKFFFITEKSGGPGAPPSSAIESGGHRSEVFRRYRGVCHSQMQDITPMNKNGPAKPAAADCPCGLMHSYG